MEEIIMRRYYSGQQVTENTFMAHDNYMRAICAGGRKVFEVNDI